LTDKSIILDIVDAINPQASQVVVEIGPGLAALTQPLVERLGHLTVIELDRDLALRLRAHQDLTVIESDVLKVDFSRISDKKIRVVGNLPYNISTPILFHLLGYVEHIEDQYFMLQKEVIDRMVAPPDSSDYSRLSVMLQWRYEMANILFVPPTSFDPPPRVDSAIVSMLPRANPPNIDMKQFSELVQVAFSQRRKLMRHTLGKWLDEKKYSGYFDLQRRAQEVPVQEYIDLALSV
jgi:16S rRNA (adenine1518-N6/adenine1519-N6)-dimethyltransferase